MKHVFISYAHVDKEYVEKSLIRELKNQYIPYWYDEDLPIGGRWAEDIDQAISESFALILVMTPASRQSGYVNYEWAYALGKGIEIVPIVVETLDVKEPKDDWHRKILDRQIGKRYDFDKMVSRLKELQHPIPIHIPKHPNISDIQSVFSDYKTQEYDNLADIESGCVVAITANEGEVQKLLDELKTLKPGQCLNIKVVLFTLVKSDLIGAMVGILGKNLKISNFAGTFNDALERALEELK